MPEHASTLHRQTIKGERREATGAAGKDEQEEADRSPFSVLIPGSRRQAMFKAPKGRLGMD